VVRQRQKWLGDIKDPGGRTRYVTRKNIIESAVSTNTRSSRRALNWSWSVKLETSETDDPCLSPGFALGCAGDCGRSHADRDLVPAEASHDHVHGLQFGVRAARMTRAHAHPAHRGLGHVVISDQYIHGRCGIEDPEPRDYECPCLGYLFANRSPCRDGSRDCDHVPCHDPFHVLCDQLHELQAFSLWAQEEPPHL